GAAGAGHTFRGPLVPRAALCQPEVPSRATSFEAKGAKEPGPAEEEIDPSKLESGLPDDDERTECNLDALKLGNQT
ncbi:unnamed protein product, partial [Effrenium voratum]